MTFVEESDSRVVETVKRIRALKRLAKREQMHTYKSQTELLKQLPADVLATVAIVLEREENDEPVRK
jgi:hypothetical protein